MAKLRDKIGRWKEKDIEIECVPSGCWEVVSHSLNGKLGYPQILRDGKLWVVHRYVWTRVKGAIPEGLLVLHKCDNKRCVNLDHLYLGTLSDNAIDAVVRVKRTTLTEDAVREIRRLHSKGMMNKDIAPMFNVSRHHISKVVNHKRWAWVKGDDEPGRFSGGSV